jgi:hypothetical protein
MYLERMGHMHKALVTYERAFELDPNDPELLINLGLMGLAVLLRRPLFMVFGALGVAGYLGHLSYEVFRDSLLFPVLLTLVGLLLIALGIAYQKHRDSLTASLRARLPESLQAFLPALRR